MNKRDALRLKPGTNILFGDTSRVREGKPYRGEVIHVTPKGGIKVEERAYEYPHEPLGVRWVPYHHVYRIDLS